MSALSHACKTCSHGSLQHALQNHTRGRSQEVKHEMRMSPLVLLTLQTELDIGITFNSHVEGCFHGMPLTGSLKQPQHVATRLDVASVDWAMLRTPIAGDKGETRQYAAQTECIRSLEIQGYY